MRRALCLVVLVACTHQAPPEALPRGPRPDLAAAAQRYWDEMHAPPVLVPAATVVAPTTATPSVRVVTLTIADGAEELPGGSLPDGVSGTGATLDDACAAAKRLAWDAMVDSCGLASGVAAHSLDTSACVCEIADDGVTCVTDTDYTTCTELGDTVGFGAGSGPPTVAKAAALEDARAACARNGLGISAGDPQCTCEGEDGDRECLCVVDAACR